MRPLESQHLKRGQPLSTDPFLIVVRPQHLWVKKRWRMSEPPLGDERSSGR